MIYGSVVQRVHFVKVPLAVEDAGSGVGHGWIFGGVLADEVGPTFSGGVRGAAQGGAKHTEELPAFAGAEFVVAVWSLRDHIGSAGGVVAAVDDGLGRVEAEAVELEQAEQIDRGLAEELAGRGMREVDHVAPRRGSADIDVAGQRLQGRVDQVIVDEVEDDGARGIVSRTDQSREIERVSHRRSRWRRRGWDCSPNPPGWLGIRATEETRGR